MPKLLPGQPGVTPVAPETLDQLWHEAVSLGWIRVWQNEYNRAYEVTITFKRPSGTEIKAVGKDSEIGAAIAKALNEAREMGAGA